MSNVTIYDILKKIASPRCNATFIKNIAEEITKHISPGGLGEDIGKSDERIAQFLCQIAHESGGFFYKREAGSESYFLNRYGKRTSIIPKGAAQKGIDYFFIGRTFVQVTHDFNYKSYAKWANAPEIVARPSLLEQPKHCVLGAIWYWMEHELYEYEDDIRTVTKRVNGGYNGLADRTKYYNIIIKMLKNDDVDGLPMPTSKPKAEIEVLQNKLKDLKYNEVGGITGEVNSRTVGALSSFQSDNGLAITGEFDDETIKMLDEAEPRQISGRRANGKPDEDDETTKAAKNATVIGASSTAVLGAPTIIDAASPLLEQAETGKQMVERVQDIYSPVKGYIKSNPEIIITGLCLVILFFGYQIYSKIIKDYRNGNKF